MSDADDEMKQWIIEIDRETAELAESKLDFGERSDVVRNLVEVIAHSGYSNRTPYDIQLRRLKEKRKELVSERSRIDAEIEDIDSQIETLQEKRSEWESEADQLEGALQRIDYDLRTSGMNVYPENPKVKDIASQFGMTAEEVVRRSMERNPDVPPNAFSNPDDDAYFDDWNGLPEGDAGTPVEEREELYDHEI